MQNKAENRDSRAAKAIASSEKEGCVIQRQWSELPTLPLEKIYSLVNRNDQVNMSLVCRRWSEGFDSPSVWKTFRFHLTECQLLMESSPVMKHVRKYSCMFQQVEISYGLLLNDELRYTWCKYFIEFMQILASSSQLISVQFKSLVWCFEHLICPVREETFRAVAKFLESQHHLKRVEFHEWFYKLSESIELLKESTKNSKEAITHIALRGFIHHEVEYLAVAEILPVLLGFPNLTTLEIDYLVFENVFARQYPIIKSLNNFRNQMLSKLILHYESDYMCTEDFKGLTSTDWRILKERYPDLQVEFNFSTHSLSRRELELIFLPNMPITMLNCTFEDVDESPFMEIDILFHHLIFLNLNDHLVSLSINPLCDVTSVLIPFIQSCAKLRFLKLVLTFPINGIHLLIESWLENPPKSLKEVQFSTSRVDEFDCMILMNIINVYETRLETAGLTVRVN